MKRSTNTLSSGTRERAAGLVLETEDKEASRWRAILSSADLLRTPPSPTAKGVTPSLRMMIPADWSISTVRPPNSPPKSGV